MKMKLLLMVTVLLLLAAAAFGQQYAVIEDSTRVIAVLTTDASYVTLPGFTAVLMAAPIDFSGCVPACKLDIANNKAIASQNDFDGSGLNDAYNRTIARNERLDLKAKFIALKQANDAIIACDPPGTCSNAVFAAAIIDMAKKNNQFLIAFTKYLRGALEGDISP